MALTRTLAQLIADSKELADQTNSSAIGDATWTRWINQAITSLYDKLIRAKGFEYYGTKATADTTADTETIALPTDTYKIWGVSTDIGGQQVSLERMNIADRDSYDVSGGWTISSTLRYLPMAANLLLRPIPGGVYTITYWYCPHATALVETTDTFDGINGWEEYVELSAAIKGLLKEESAEAAQMLGMERAEMAKRIEDMSTERDEGSGTTITRTRRRGNRYGDDWDC